MDFQEIIFYGCLFFLVAAPTYWGSWLVMQRKQQRLNRRLQSERSMPVSRGSRRGGLLSSLTRLSEAAAAPLMPSSAEEQSALRRQCAQAGIYSPVGVRAVMGLKLILVVGGVAAGYGVGALLGQVLLGVGFGGLLGYFGPTIWLRSSVTARQRSLERALPDALDLMVVCVESGLTMDASTQRVGQEIALAHPELAQELDIMNMEMQVGVARADSLRNLGIRTGSGSLQSLAAMLIQADRFGTSIAQALRIHAESMRTRRQYLAEEQAAKASVKLSFPLVLFIFPALLIVVAGPAIISLLDSPLFKK